MGNIILGIKGRSNNYDVELQGSASDQPENAMKNCDCVDTPEIKCLHWAIIERNIKYAS